MPKEKKITLACLKKEVNRLDPKLSSKDETFKTALVLLAGLKVTADAKKIADFTKLPLAFVKAKEKNLRRNKVWVGTKTNCEWFQENGGIAFWMDVLVADGMANRVSQ